MKLNEKLRLLREIEGDLRGLGRALTQGEVLRALHGELGESLSQSYLSQIETGKRPHLTNSSRLLLARFFKVHPGFLVDDPEGYHAELLSDARLTEQRLDTWLLGGAERFGSDAELHSALLTLARHVDSRQCLLLLERLLLTPGAVDHLSAFPDLRVPQTMPGQQAAATLGTNFASDDASCLDGDMQ